MIIFDNTPESTKTGNQNKSTTRREATQNDFVKFLNGLFYSGGGYQDEQNPGTLQVKSAVFRIPQGCTSVTVDHVIKTLGVPQIAYLRDNDTFLQKLLNDEEFDSEDAEQLRGASFTLNNDGMDGSVGSTDEPFTVSTIKDHGYLIVALSEYYNISPHIYFNF